MLHQEFEAPETLQHTIQCFWYTQLDFGPQPSSFEILPDGHAEIIFHFGYPCTVSYRGTVQPLPSPFLMGLLNQPVLIHTQGQFSVIGIRCFPWTVFDLLGLPSGNKGVHMFEHPIAGLQPVLHQCIATGRIEEAINELKKYFLNTASGQGADVIVSKAGAAMQQAAGTLPVSGVAAAAHATVRTLERRFKQATGHTVKDISGVMRFEQVRNRLWIDPDVSLAGLSLELGYTDQAHLSKEFRRYSGTTPAAFARKTRKAKQIAGGDFVAFVQA